MLLHVCWACLAAKQLSMLQSAGCRKKKEVVQYFNSIHFKVALRTVALGSIVMDGQVGNHGAA